jgi:hypothetical protein
MKKEIAGPVVRFIGVASLALVFTASLPAQYVIGTKAGIIEFIEGNVFLEDKPVILTPGHYVQMENGQTVRTGKGFAELLLNPGAYIRLGENTLLRVEQNKFSDTQLTLLQGSVLIESIEEIKGNRIRVRLGEDIVEASKVGLYRIEAASKELRVYGGAALVASRNKEYAVTRDRMVRLNKNHISEKFNANETDSLHQWAAKRSFDLFIASPAGQSHWAPVAMGWLVNTNYHARFRSQKFLDNWEEEKRKQDYDEMIKEAQEAIARAQTTGLTADDAEIIRQALEAVKAKQLETVKKKGK